ncbi:hypothetical protein [Streptomyces caeruleatus]|uniref:Aromatic ring-opening dioxygenase LigA n=1 Tax=Streptomyces caeruleatus TaxID=661399 RepID=A0A117RKR2_9ACTN|nr:hypothetical protein [Streptomyces caeruleatus]KUN96178.1 aromatic ring-opening dioxygenase LigA [Streptomyces caeruleatus]
MTRIPDAVTVASLDTHRLIVTVPNEGPADIACNLPRPVAAHILRQLVDGLDSPAGRCSTAVATGHPCPIHDAPASPSEAPLAASTPAQRAAGEARQCLAFNADQQSPTLASLRDLLLDTEARTPAAALTTAYVLLAAHTRELSALAKEHTDATRTRWGVTRSTRGLLTGKDSIRKLLDSLATALDEQADQ